VGEFVKVSRPKVPAQQMPRNMPGGVTNSVFQIERRYGNAANTADRSPQPELFGFRDIEELHSGIPEAKMKFQIQGHFRIVVIAAPLPAGVSDHGWQVISSRMRISRNGIIPDFRYSEARCSYVLNRAVEIDIVLRADLGTIAEVRKVREAFQDNERDAAPREGSADFVVGIDRAGKPTGIRCEIVIDTATNCIRQHTATANSERKSQARFIGESEQRLPFRLAEMFQIAACVLVESERINQ